LLTKRAVEKGVAGVTMWSSVEALQVHCG